MSTQSASVGALGYVGLGVSSLEDWAQFADLLGLMPAGFPNLFLITGPGSPSVLSNMMTSIEQHVRWIGDCLSTLRGRTIEATPEAERAWVEHGNAVAAPTVYPEAKSWYTGANIPGKPRTFMAYIGGVPGYRHICEAIVEQGYAGFAIDGRASQPPADFAALMAPTQEAAAA